MTIAAVSPAREDYAGSGTGPYTFHWRITDKAQLEVFKYVTATGVVTTMVVDTDYTVSGVGNATGSITTIASVAASSTLVILRNQPVEQASGYTAEAFPSGRLERDFDKLVMTQQMFTELFRRTMKFAKKVSTVAPDVDTPSDGKFLYYDLAQAKFLWGTPASFTAALPLSIANGGSGAITAATARTAFGAAPTTPSYLTLATDSELTSERVLTAGAGISLTDAGAGSTLTIANTNTVAPDFFSGYKPVYGSTTSITVNPGSAADSTNAAALTLASAMAKTTSNWAAGTGNGGAFVAIGSNTTYHWFAIQKTSDLTIDIGFDTSLTAANIPSGYGKKVYLFSTKSNASSQWRPFDAYTNGDEIEIIYRTFIQDVNTTANFSTQAAVTLGSVPSGIRFEAIVDAISTPNAAGDVILISDPSQTGVTTSSATVGPNTLHHASTQRASVCYYRVKVNTSASVNVHASYSGGSFALIINTHGYKGPRGNAAAY